MRAFDLIRQTRARVLGGCALVGLIVVVAVAATGGGDDDERLVSAAGASTSTTERATTTRPPTTTTTEATTTTATTAPPTTVPPPPPPPPAPPPPPPQSLDLGAVVAFAQTHRPNTDPPYMYSGSSCEVTSERIFDMGDDTNADLGDVSLVRDCAGTFRLFTGASDTQALGAYWIEIDSAPGGCGGVDVVAATWPSPPSMKGAVVRTPGCDQGSWAAIDTTANPGFPGRLLDFRGSTFGDPMSFQWRAGMVGSGDTQIDRAPSSGFAVFQR